MSDNSTTPRVPSQVLRRDPDFDELPEVMAHVEEKVLVSELATEYGFLSDALIKEKMDELTKADEWRWELYQKRYFRTEKWYISNKCRQSGMSAAGGAKKFAAGILASDEYTCIMTSYKKEEAQNKIEYVRKYLRALPPEFEKEELRTPLQLIEWRNQNGSKAKILSHAQKPIRGASGEVFLDELAFYQHGDEIYESATPVVTQSGGTIDIVSTPFGKGGRFYDLFTSREDDDFFREAIFWWLVRRYLKVPTLDYMVKVAKVAMTDAFDTNKRVEMFGNDTIKSQLKNAKLMESFQQEFECVFIDDSVAFFGRDLILAIMFNNRTEIDDYQPLVSDFLGMTPEEALKDLQRSEAKKKSVELIYQNKSDVYGNPISFKKYFAESPRASESFGSFYDLMNAIHSGEITDNLLIGLDIGKSTNSTSLEILEEVYVAGGGILQIERGSIEIQKTALHEQQYYLEKYLDLLPWQKAIGDAGGLGAQMCDYFKSKWPGRFHTVNFATGGPSKVEPLMVNLRSRMSNFSIAIAYDKKQIDELHSIQRVITETKKISYKAPEKKGTHADSAYALAMACYAGTLYSESERTFDLSRMAIPSGSTESESFVTGDELVEAYSLGDLRADSPRATTAFDGLEFGIGAVGFFGDWEI